MWGSASALLPVMHPAMKSVAEVRRQLGVPTIFNLLGPLCNPARTPHQLLGVGKPALLPLMAEVVHQLGCQRSVLVSGSDGLDEVSLAVATNVRIVTADGIEEAVWTPARFWSDGSKAGRIASFRAAGECRYHSWRAQRQKGAVRGILSCSTPQPEFGRSGLESDLGSAAHRVQAAIDDGSALEDTAAACRVLCQLSSVPGRVSATVASRQSFAAPITLFKFSQISVETEISWIVAVWQAVC